MIEITNIGTGQREILIGTQPCAKIVVRASLDTDNAPTTAEIDAAIAAVKDMLVDMQRAYARGDRP